MVTETTVQLTSRTDITSAGRPGEAKALAASPPVTVLPARFAALLSSIAATVRSGAGTLFRRMAGARRARSCSRREARTLRSPDEQESFSEIVVRRTLLMADATPPLGEWYRLLLNADLSPEELSGLPWDAYDRRERVLIIPGSHVKRPSVVPLNGIAVRVIESQPRTGRAIFSWPDGEPVTPDDIAQMGFVTGRPQCAATGRPQSR